MFKHEPLNASGFIERPKKLKRKHAIINLKNSHDNKCFKWSILAALHHEKVSKNKVSDALSYARWTYDLNFHGIDFPVQLNQIEKFMEQNEGLAINVYHYNSKNEQVSPLFLAKKPLGSDKPVLGIERTYLYYC